MASESVANLAHPKQPNARIQQRSDSMEPTIELGDWVDIDPNVTAYAGPGMYLTAWRNFEPKPHYPRQVPQLRRLALVGGDLHVTFDNPVYPSFKVNAANVLIGGKVLERQDMNREAYEAGLVGAGNRFATSAAETLR